jgi:hypothetical protein
LVAVGDEPATVKKFAVTPVKVYPVSAVSVMVAVYICDPANLPPVSAGDQDTVPEYWPLSATDVTAVTPATGAATPVMAVILTVAADAGKQIPAKTSRTMHPMKRITCRVTGHHREFHHLSCAL